MKKLFFFLVSFFFGATCYAQFTFTTTLTAPDGAPGDFFGAVIAIDGDYALISSFQDDDQGMNSGSVYVFHLQGGVWTQQAKLTATDGAAGDWFGGALGIRDDIALIGATQDDDQGTDSGSAYVFERTGEIWTQTAKLVASDGAPGDWFAAHNIEIEGDFIFVGAWWDDDHGESSGSAYVFKKEGNSWTQHAKLTAADASPNAWFGNGIRVDGDYAVINAPSDQNVRGAAYIFKWNGQSWEHQAKLTAADGTDGDSFGSDVAIFDDYVLVGAARDDDNGEDSGAAYVFQRSGDTWTQVAKLVPSDGAAGDNAGYNVDLYENIAVVCAEFDDDMTGSVYVFQRSGTTWKEVEKHIPPDAAAGMRFGHDLKIFENTIMAGAIGANNGQGAVYVYGLSTPVEQIAQPNNSFELYPNPADREVVISGMNGQHISFVNLYDQFGRLLQRLSLSDNVLDVSRLSPGLYYVGLEVDRKMAFKKLMVR